MMSDKANLGENVFGSSGPQGFICVRKWVRCTIFGIVGLIIDRLVNCN